ncbi:MAG: hypothetical protein ACLT38_07910 [Akkermansia sp.]
MLEDRDLDAPTELAAPVLAEVVDGTLKLVKWNDAVNSGYAVLMV